MEFFTILVIISYLFAFVFAILDNWIRGSLFFMKLFLGLAWIAAFGMILTKLF